MPIAQIFKDEGCAPVKIWTDDVEASALQQLHNMSTLPFIHKHIAVMPDVHWGMGSTVGSVIPTQEAIVPASVGVDLGCGMMAQKLDLKAHELPESLAQLRSGLEANIPHGRTNNGQKGDRGAWGFAPSHVQSAWRYMSLAVGLQSTIERHPKLMGKHTLDSGLSQLGTLGTGNHFVEICLDLEDNVWIMLHSGSRGIGNRIGSYFISAAKELMERYRIKLADPDLAFIPEAEPIFQDYMNVIGWAQSYAQQNRELMMGAARNAVNFVMQREVKGSDIAVNCHHNYVSIENHFGEKCYVTRKGAVRAREGDLGIIPGSMGARSFIVRGKGNADSFHSCSHGAGRAMSRGEARRRFTQEDLALQTAGVECRKDADVIDEIPSAYKSIEAVMANQSDLVDVVAELKQVLCVKG